MQSKLTDGEGITLLIGLYGGLWIGSLAEIWAYQNHNWEIWTSILIALPFVVWFINSIRETFRPKTPSPPASQPSSPRSADESPLPPAA